MSQAETTKVERLVEGIEALVVASVVLNTAHDAVRPVKMLDVKDARDELGAALREFLRPSLRLVQ